MKPNYKIVTKNLNFFYGEHQALFDNDLAIEANKITAVIGPSGCGKSTHLRIYNRIYELHRGQRAEGEVLLDGQNILAPDVDRLELRRRVGMIFQKPTPFPMSVFDNVAYPLKLHFKMNRREIAHRVEEACAARRSGTRSRTSSTSPARPSRADSSNGSASPAPSPPSRKSCSWTSRRARSTPSAR